MTTDTRGGVSERAVNDQMGEMTVTVVTDPRTQIPAHRRHIVSLLGGGRVGVRDRWTDELVAECPGGCPEAIAKAAVLNGKAVPGIEDELAGLTGLLFGGER